MAKGKVFKDINFLHNESDIQENQLIEFDEIRKQLKKYFARSTKLKKSSFDGYKDSHSVRYGEF